jgi:site-specific DNA recombinase
MPNERKIACALVRVSSEEQARGGYGLEFQEQDIRTFCTHNNFELLRVFRDEGYSGTTAERPGLQEMLTWARQKRFHTLVIWKLDRLFRNTKLTLQTVDELASLDIDVRSVQESFTHDSNGRFLLTIFAAGAEKERKDIAMRMYAGRLASARKGTWVLGGVPFGYRYDMKRKRLAIDEGEAKIVRRMFRWMVNEKLSLYKVQSRLNELQVPTRSDRLGKTTPTGTARWWAKRTIGRILTNEVYQGVFRSRKHTKSNLARPGDSFGPEGNEVSIKTPLIISRSLFEKAQAQLRENSLRSPRRTKELYLLRGLLVCGHDHRRMQAARQVLDRGHKRSHKYYFCTGTRKAFAAVRCTSRALSESRVASPVWAKLMELLTNPATVFNHIEEYREQKIKPAEASRLLTALQEQKKRSLGRHHRLVELYLGESIEKGFFDAENLKLGLDIERIDGELARARSMVATDEEIAAKVRTAQELYKLYKTKLAVASDEIKRELLMLFVKRITVVGEELHMEVNLPEPGAFAGQASQRSSHKDEFPIILHTKLLSVSEIFKQKEMHKNFLR